MSMATGPPDAAVSMQGAAANGSVSSSATAEAELVADFTASPIFRAGFESPDRLSRQPRTLASIERRWFVGKQTKRSADALAAQLLGAEVEEHFVLIGTVALLELARAGHWVIQVNERHIGQHLEFTVHVPTTQRGRPKKDASTTGRHVPSRRYFVSPTLATLCEEALESKHPISLPERIHAARCDGRIQRGQRSGNSDHSRSSATINANFIDFDLDYDDSFPSSGSGESEDGGLDYNDAIRELADVPVEWLPREESCTEPDGGLDYNDAIRELADVSVEWLPREEPCTEPDGGLDYNDAIRELADAPVEWLPREEPCTEPDGGLGYNDAIRELADVPVEWLPREESWTEPLPEMPKSSLGPETVAARGYNYTEDIPKSEMMRAYVKHGARERGLSWPWPPSDWLSADTIAGDSDVLQSSSPYRKKQRRSEALLAGMGITLLLVVAVLAVQNRRESKREPVNDSSQSQESPAVAINNSFACNVGCPPGSFAIGRVCNRRSDTSLDFTGGHCAEWTLEGAARSTKLAAPWPSTHTYLFGGMAALSPAWSGVALDGDGSDSGLWVYTVASNLSDASGLGPGADSTCPTMWHYSHTESKWSRVSVQALALADPFLGECVGAPDPTPMPSPRIQPHTFVDSNSGLLFLHGGSGCPGLGAGQTPSGVSSCQMPGDMTDMWAFAASKSPSMEEQRWIAVSQEDPFGASCSTSYFKLCASGIRLGALITTISPLAGRIRPDVLSDTVVATGSVYLFGGYDMNTQRSLPHLWGFSYEYDTAESRIAGRWTILASQRSARSVASSENECNVGSYLSMPDQICDICDVAPCPDARAGAASWSGGKHHGSSEGRAVGWIFGGYSMEKNIMFNDLWQLNDYHSVVGPMPIWDWTTNTDSNAGLGGGLWPGPKPIISSSQPLWRQIQRSGVAESVDIGQSQPYRLDITVGTWPTVAEFAALGSSTEIGALWMLTGYETPFSPAINVGPTKLKEQMTPTLWSFEISTGVWSRVQLVEAVVPTHHSIPAMADVFRRTLWPAARTAAVSVGESCTRSGASSGHSRDGIGAGWLFGGHGDRECADDVNHTHHCGHHYQQNHYLGGLWRLAVVGKEQRAQTPAFV